MTHSSKNSEFWQSDKNTKMHLSRNILFGLQLLSRENHTLSGLDIWHSGSLDLYLQKWFSDFFYLTQFLNYEVNLVKFTLFEIVNLIIHETSQIREIATPLFKIQVQGTTVPNLKVRD